MIEVTGMISLGQRMTQREHQEAAQALRTLHRTLIRASKRDREHYGESQPQAEGIEDYVGTLRHILDEVWKDSVSDTAIGNSPYYGKVK